MHPLRRLFGYARQYRSDVIIASIYSVFNKFFDVLPEILIGVAVDVVVNRKDSFVARVGIADPKDQLILLALLARGPVPFILYGAFWFQSRLASRYTAVREAAGALAARLNNNLTGVATIKAYTAEDFEAEHIRQGSDAYRERNGEAIRWS